MALQWQGANAMAPRALHARAEALRQVSWVQSMGNANAAIAVCGANGLLQGEGACSGAALAPDQIEVLVRYPYLAGPLVPVLPGGAALAADAADRARLGAARGPVAGG